MTETTRPAVLFVCVHNAGRSQMAAGYLQALAGDRIDVFSAGSEPGDRVNPAAVAVMAEEGIDLSAATPRVLTVDAVRRADVVITMGCGDACPIFPGRRQRQHDEPVRLIRGCTAAMDAPHPACLGGTGHPCVCWRARRLRR